MKERELYRATKSGNFGGLIQWTRYFKGFYIGRTLGLRLCKSRLSRRMWLDGWLLDHNFNIWLRRR